jgi:hypothetical protein
MSRKYQPRPLHPSFDPTSKTNRAQERSRRIYTPMGRKARRAANVYTVPSLRNRAMTWILSRLA